MEWDKIRSLKIGTREIGWMSGAASAVVELEAPANKALEELWRILHNHKRGRSSTAVISQVKKIALWRSPAQRMKWYLWPCGTPSRSTDTRTHQSSASKSGRYSRMSERKKFREARAI